MVLLWVEFFFFVFKGALVSHLSKMSPMERSFPTVLGCVCAVSKDLTEFPALDTNKGGKRHVAPAHDVGPG